MYLTKVTFILLIIISQGCSDDDFSPGCYQEEGRRIVATITNEEGTINEPGTSCPDQYIIEPDNKTVQRPLGLYDPCNLESEFQIAGVRVVFSGYVYESFDNEDICADFFEITSIRIIDP